MAQIIIGGDAPAQTTIDNGGGTYDVAIVAFTSNPTATFVGPGTYDVNIDASLVASYTVVATNGAVLNVDTTGSLGTTSNLVIDGASTISIGDAYSAFNATNVDFTESHGTGGGTLILPPGKLAFMDTPPVVSNFALDDNIDFGSAYNSLDNITYTATGPNTGTLSLLGPDGQSLGVVTLLGNYAAGEFSIGQGPGNTAEIVCNVACFLRGTLIETGAGEVAVESLRAGDMVMTLTHGLKPIKAVRLRSFSAAAEVESPRLRPVHIAAGALGDGLPRRELRVSPDHAMYLDGALVPAQLLVNGSTVTQPAHAQPIDYFHLEIETHDIIIAEGAATESYLDIGHRGHFEQAGVVSLMPRLEPKTWDDACAPLVLGGAALERIRKRLAAAEFAPVGIAAAA